MTTDELSKFLEDNRDAVLDATRKAVLEKVTESVRWNLPDTIHQTVASFLKDEIAPEVAKMLQEQKGPILEAAKKSAAALSDELAKRMMETVTTNLDGYRAEKVFKALLGVSDRGY
jgi:hypothetical protein